MRTRLVATKSPFTKGILSGAGNAAKKLKSPASKSCIQNIHKCYGKIKQQTLC